MQADAGAEGSFFVKAVSVLQQLALTHDCHEHNTTSSSCVLLTFGLVSNFSTELGFRFTYSASRSLQRVFLLGVSVCRKAARVSKTEPIFSTPPPLTPPPTCTCACRLLQVL